MAQTNGWHFFMNPGPTNIPDRILRAMDRGTLDFTGAAFKEISDECFAGLQRVFKTEQPILGYAATGHGAWEAALVNLFSPGDKAGSPPNSPCARLAPGRLAPASASSGWS